jgi:hypothetical protein
MSVPKKIEAYNTLPPVASRPTSRIPFNTKRFIITTFAAMTAIIPIFPQRVNATSRRERSAIIHMK